MRKLLYFRADWCGVCHERAAAAAAISETLALPLEVVDVEDAEGGARALDLRVRTVPTLALVDGQRVPFRLVGRMISVRNAVHLAALTRAPEGGSGA